MLRSHQRSYIGFYGTPLSQSLGELTAKGRLMIAGIATAATIGLTSLGMVKIAENSVSPAPIHINAPSARNNNIELPQRLSQAQMRTETGACISPLSGLPFNCDIATIKPVALQVPGSAASEHLVLK